jgi:hypothetical protein
MRLVVLLAALTATASAANAADRYGPGGSAPPQAGPTAAAQVAPAAGQHRLSWAGKTEPTAPASVQQQADARPAPMRLPPPQGAWRRPGAGTPPASPAAMAPAALSTSQPQAYAASSTAAAPPTSLYGSPAAPTQSQYAPRTQAVAATPQPGRSAPYAGGPRYYSVHRDYGMAPDPIPAALPQPFFNGQQADLAEPPPPVDPRTPAQQRAAAAAAGNGVASARPGSQGGDWGASDDPGLAAGDASQNLTGQTPTETGLQNTNLGSGHP